MKNLLCIFSLLFIVAGSCLAQEQHPEVNFHTPLEWRGETLKLPPGFAPDLKWNGIEHIRFAPGMFQSDSESFFSYVLVFLLNKGDDISDESLHAQILTYYGGLAKAVMGGKSMSVKTEDFQLKLDPAEGDQKGKVWTGVLDWVEPFATQKPQKLNMEVHLLSQKDEAPILYFTVSPQETNHAIWKEMRGYRAKFEVGKKEQG